MSDVLNVFIDSCACDARQSRHHLADAARKRARDGLEDRFGGEMRCVRKMVTQIECWLNDGNQYRMTVRTN